MFHYENDDYECAADPFCPPAFPVSDETNDGEWDGYVSEADEIAGESDYMPGYDDGEWDDHESLCGEEDFA